MDKFEVRAEKSASGSTILHLSGPVTLNTLFELQDALRKETTGTLIIVLTDVPYMDSAGLGAILSAYASCQRHQRKFGLASVSERVMALLRVTKVDSLVPQYPTVEAAEADLGTKAEGA
ncbi:MAG TPA: STAS domain-containing protein [Bryobacteraceae bacterium]|jgi:anti-sigma B factor antagonist|nr:STAS domain-containing protein [Bryobacteraceae bacterium]